MDTVISLVRFLRWPAILLITFGMFQKPLSELVGRINHVEVGKDEKGNYKMSSNAVAAAVNLGVATGKSLGAGGEAKTPVDIQELANSVTSAASSASLSDAKVLWVDDNPTNNVYSRRALSALGIRVDLVTNTAEALKKLGESKYKLVIFARRDDSQEGYTLLEQVKKLPDPPPLIIYSSLADLELQKEAKYNGAYAVTNSPQQLFDLSVGAILGKPTIHLESQGGKVTGSLQRLQSRLKALRYPVDTEFERGLSSDTPEISFNPKYRASAEEINGVIQDLGIPDAELKPSNAQNEYDLFVYLPK